MRAGCEHNLDRTITWPSQIRANGNTTYQPGQYILLVCPHGCPDVVWAMRGCHDGKEAL